MKISQNKSTEQAIPDFGELDDDIDVTTPTIVVPAVRMPMRLPTVTEQTCSLVTDAELRRVMPACDPLTRCTRPITAGSSM